jgi:hypothetical protein
MERSLQDMRPGGHYRGDGVFMLSGPNTSEWRKRFKPHML